MIKIIDLKFNVQDSIDYLNKLNSDYEHYHWHYVKHHNDPRSLGDNNSLKTMHGYGLQTVYEDTTFPYHCDIDPHDEGPEYFKDTELVFGFYKDIRTHFTDVFRSFIMTFKQGDHIGKWTGGTRKHYKIIIPIVSNNTAWLRGYKGDEVIKIVPEVGKIYQVEMVKNHAEILNEGEDDISFLVFNVIKEYV